MKTTMFPDIFKKHTPKHVEVPYLFEWIKSGKSGVAEKITRLRAELDPSTKANIKKSLPAICFSGVFSARYDDKVVEHSGLACLDFDKLEDPDGFKNKLRKDPFICAAFISPGGRGVKALVIAPATSPTKLTQLSCSHRKKSRSRSWLASQGL